MGRMSRAFAFIESATVDTTLANCQEVNIEEWASGNVHVVTNGITSLTFYGAVKPGGTFVPIYTAAGVAVALTVVNTRSYPLPSECFGMAAIKMVPNTNGTVHLSLKG